MEKFVYYSLLSDIYKGLLTEKNYRIINLYYSENLSMQEIADLLKVSKSFVGTSIKNTEAKLDDLENKLHNLKRIQKLRELLEEKDIDTIKKEIQKLID